MKKSAITLLILQFCFLVQAQTGQSPDVKFDHIGIREGLPEADVQAMAQDEGYIWMGTQNGLVRYDGYRYKIYNLGSDQLNKTSFTSVRSIFVDKQKTLWVATVLNGLFRYDRKTNQFQQFAYPAQKNIIDVRIGAEDHEGNLWCGFSSGIFKFNPLSARFEFFGIREKGSNYINSKICYLPYQTLDGTIWVGTHNGLLHYISGKGFKTYFATTDTAKTRGFNPVYEAPSEPGVLWANTFHGSNYALQLTRFDTRTNGTTNYLAGKKPGNMVSVNIRSIYEDHKKRLWFATDTGLSEYDRANGKFTNYIAKDPLKHALQDFLETKNGDFWLTSLQGLVFFNSRTGEFKRYNGKDDPIYIQAKLLDNTGQIWAAAGGVYKSNYLKSAFYIEKSITGGAGTYLAPSFLMGPTDSGKYLLLAGRSFYQWSPLTHVLKKLWTGGPGITAACLGDDHIIYLGTAGKGLLTHNLRTGKNETYGYKSLSSNAENLGTIRLLYKDHTGTIWMGTYGGLRSFDPHTRIITRYPFRPTDLLGDVHNDGRLDDRLVNCVYEDHNNTLWFGTNSGGLNRFDRKTHQFYSYFSKKNRKIVCLTSMYEDHAGRFWVGTYFRGLFEFDRKKGVFIKNIDEQSGMLHNYIPSISEDTMGRLWIITARGITRYNPQSNAIQNFKIAMVLPGEEIAGSVSVDQYHHLNSPMVTGLKDGLVTFNPESLDPNLTPPIVHLERLAYRNPLSADSAKSIIPYGVKTLELPYNKNRLRFDYIALHFNDPSQNRYAYRLDGYDKNWMQAGTLRSATYTNLPSGTYTFHVRACNSDGVWNNTGDSITVIIDTALWMRWWAWLLYAILFIVSIYAFVAYRSRKLTRDKRELEHTVRLRTEEVMEQKEEIEAQHNYLEKAFSELKLTQAQLIQSEKMASLGELTAGIAHEIQNPLNFVNNFSDVNREMIDELKAELRDGNIGEALDIAEDILQNEQKINHHGKRAGSIVKGMLEHSRASCSQKELTNINILADEYLNLAYHGLMAKDKNFNAVLVVNFEPGLPLVPIVGQDIGRVLLNLFNNAFYAVQQKEKIAGPGYKPTVTLTTFKAGNQVMVNVKDNGNGIPDAIKDKIMQPFFTTKPTGEGTGLGLSLSYDIIVKGHQGDLNVESTMGESTTFSVILRF